MLSMWSMWWSMWWSMYEAEHVEHEVEHVVEHVEHVLTPGQEEAPAVAGAAGRPCSGRQERLEPTARLERTHA